ncbi:MAG: hypothetical protein Q7S30_00585 [Candidatus Omnitrophota bacterium]|nr:hypothetical protein [Candidatus Omnitrophota bacterium]
MKDRAGGVQMLFGLVGILLSLMIVVFLYYLTAKAYLVKPKIDKETQKIASEQGIDTGNYRSLVDTVKKKLQDSQAQEMEHAKAMEEFK